MAINPISLRSAYSQAAQSIEKRELTKKSVAVAPSESAAPENYSKNLTKSALAASNPDNSQAAFITRTPAAQPTPTSSAPRPSDSLVDNFDYGEAKKDTRELEGYARRYLKVIQDQTPPAEVDKKVEGLVQFYGGNPEREQRFKNFVTELEAGQEAKASTQKAEVAIA